jgi:hypothetical protein
MAAEVVVASMGSMEARAVLVDPGLRVLHREDLARAHLTISSEPMKRSLPRPSAMPRMARSAAEVSIPIRLSSA